MTSVMLGSRTMRCGGQSALPQVILLKWMAFGWVELGFEIFLKLL